MEDRIALQDVILNYAAGIDDKDYDLYRNCFLENVEVHGMSEEVIIGVDAWIDFVKNALSNYTTTQHMLGPQLATVDGNRAKTRTDLRAIHYLKEDPKKIFTVWGTYRTDMVKKDGDWKISRHELQISGTRTD